MQKRIAISIGVVLVACGVYVRALPPPGTPLAGYDIVTSTTGKVVADAGAVSSEHPLASRAGLEMLQKGGNAVDAMIAAALAMTVVKNAANGLGGYGGAMVIYRRDLPEPVVVDFNTRAPLAVKTEMFYSRRADAESGILSITTWDVVAGLYTALERYGTMKWDEVIQPAIRYAEEGFVLGAPQARALKSAYDEKLHKWPASRTTYTRADGSPLQPGDRFVQKDLAGSLRTLAREGPDAIYTGQLAKTMVEYIRSQGGILAMDDLADWRTRHVRILKPARVEYRGYDLYTSPINTGGENLVAILNLLKGFDLPKMGWSADSIHVTLEAFKLGYADRLWYAADPWMAKVPYAGLMSLEYAAERRALIDLDVAWPYARPGDPWKFDKGGPGQFSPSASMHARDIPSTPAPGDTASTSTTDKDGNMVALTMTLRAGFGSGVTVPGTGITLNNGMGLFHPTESDPSPVPNHPNRLEGGKLALNNMNAFVVLKDGKPFMTGGGAGGRRIMTECLELITNVLDWRMDVQSAVAAARFHVEQKEPVIVEEALPIGIGRALEKKGHKLEVNKQWGAVEAIVIDPATGKHHVAREPRSDTSAAGGLIQGAKTSQ